MLLALILIPLITAALVPLAARRHVRWVALLGTLAPVGLVITLLAQYDWTNPPSRTLAMSADWYPDLGVNLRLNIDGLSFALVALTALLGPICVIGSFTAIKERVRTYYGWLLVLQAAMTGVFLARDAILFYVFFEFTLVPMYVLISLFGSTNRKAAATKFFLYTFTGSIIALAGIVYVAWWNATQPGGFGAWTFEFNSLIAASQKMPLQTQQWVFLALLCGFAVKVPLFPLHTWLPLAHTEAPTAGSVILAGVLLKLGTYAILVIAIPFAPQAAITFAPLIATLSLIGIVAIGLVCWVQTDVKKLVAYSSVAHLGFCMLGMFAFNHAGLQGSILYMINHGLSTGALFLMIGMMYERYHTRSMHEVGGLAAKMPIWATFMVFFSMSSVGLPGLNGFISEFLCVMGAFTAGDNWSAGRAATAGSLGPTYAFIAGTGMIIAAIYILYLVGKVCFGPLREPAGHGQHGHGHDHDAHGDDHLPADLTAREIGILVPLAVLCVALGFYPKPLMRVVEPTVRDTARLIQDTRAKMPEYDLSPMPRVTPKAASAPEARP
jgi:NADH-quinone oxidoreductase subunit M